jgi:hypothetical protein
LQTLEAIRPKAALICRLRPTSLNIEVVGIQ